MCGIFGMFFTPDARLSTGDLRGMIEALFVLSESRGKEAAGLAVACNGTVTVRKEPISPSRFLSSRQYKDFFERYGEGRFDRPVAAIGHSRLVTNGLQTMHYNNQPVRKGHLVAVHNGIIVNDDALWQQFPSMRRECDVDTEVLLALMRMFGEQGMSLENSLREAFARIEGTASVAILAADEARALLATDNGSMYCGVSEAGNAIVFASERYILQEFAKKRLAAERLGRIDISHIEPGHALAVDLDSLHTTEFDLETPVEAKPEVAPKAAKPVKIVDLSELRDPAHAGIRRCTRCILPETMPFIEFDDDGVCNFCREYTVAPFLGREALEEVMAKYRRSDGGPDCIVALSGGRDSCYGLHYIKTVLKMNPLGFTYDWGMVTDLARRNIARMCGRLGVEHILVSADIKKKRENIRRNVEAWLKKPDLGIIPLFMAGDKQFYYYANRLAKETGAELIVFCENGRLERAHFKSGFCGVNEGMRRAFNVTFGEKVKIALYYLKQFLTNPAYLNRSLLDTLFAFYSSYVLEHDYVFLYEYIPWIEEEIVSTLIDDYNWEISPDTTSTWRIGDGTAAFYNYIYYHIAGLTEHDTFRSNQIREGMITREEALRLAEEENKPRWDSMQWYARQIGFDLNEALRVINSAPTLYQVADPETGRPIR